VHADRYEILGELAVGGMATVYLAREREPRGEGRLVALKHMHPQYAGDAEVAAMFVDEARLTTRLRHPNIVPTLDVVADDERLVLVMEYVEGQSLSALLQTLGHARRSMPVPMACAIAVDILLGLHEAHEATDDDGLPLAVIHRDVSPQNVMIGLDGRARVLDFGIAKARRRIGASTAEGVVKGKLRYMPAEQLFGGSIDRRADVYATGAVLWELLCGRPLYPGPPQVVAAKVDEGIVPPPSTRAEKVSRELDAIVLAALARNPEDRFPTAWAMAEAITCAVSLPPRADIAAWIRTSSKRRNP
jgi:eukaryotic-like serine/threonine-protein kinase